MSDQPGEPRLPNKAPRLVMLGTGDFALPTFLHLLDSGHSVVTLVTQPDRPQGRKQELIPSRIKLAALERGVPVFQPENVNASESIAHLRSLGVDLMVTAAYGQILSGDLLAVPTFGGINLHGSVLPAYRGAAPVARAIENGETETGVTVIRMNTRVDAGGMIKVARTPIGPDETAGEVEVRIAVLGAPLIAETVAEIAAGTVDALPQSKSRVTKAPKLSKEDGLIDWSRPARAVHDRVRAMQPWPTCYSFVRRPENPYFEPIRLIVHKTEVVDVPHAVPPGGVVEALGDRLIVAAEPGAVRLVLVQVAGKRPMSSADFLNGRPLFVGDTFGPP